MRSFKPLKNEAETTAQNLLRHREALEVLISLLGLRGEHQYSVLTGPIRDKLVKLRLGKVAEPLVYVIVGGPHASREANVVAIITT